MQADAGWVVEFILDIRNLAVGDVCEVRSFGDVFTDVAVDALVCPALQGESGSKK